MVKNEIGYSHLLYTVNRSILFSDLECHVRGKKTGNFELIKLTNSHNFCMK